MELLGAIGLLVPMVRSSSRRDLAIHFSSSTTGIGELVHFSMSSPSPEDLINREVSPRYEEHRCKWNTTNSNN